MEQEQNKVEFIDVLVKIEGFSLPIVGQINIAYDAYEGGKRLSDFINKTQRRFIPVVLDKNGQGGKKTTKLVNINKIIFIEPLENPAL